MKCVTDAECRVMRRATRSIKGVRFGCTLRAYGVQPNDKRWEGDIRDKEESSIVQHGSNGDFDWPALESKFGDSCEGMLNWILL
jgi:hypothetical protein